MSARGSFLGSPRVKQDDQNASNCHTDEGGLSVQYCSVHGSQTCECFSDFQGIGVTEMLDGTMIYIAEATAWYLLDTHSKGSCKDARSENVVDTTINTHLIQLPTQKYNSSIRPFSRTISDIFNLKILIWTFK